MWMLVAALFCVIVLWSSRGFWRETLDAALKPTLPPAAIYHADDSQDVPSTPTSTTTPPQKKPRSAGISSSTSTHIGEPPPTTTNLPKEINLAVPFLSQAPKQNWAMPYQEACEEASMIMVNAYFADRTKSFAGDEGDQAILDIVAFETERALEADITAKQASDLIPLYFAKRQARVIVRPTVEMIRGLLAKGIPVIVPADGKALKNPNFHNGGPPYHMLVIKGYLADGRWIVNDPGTRKGADYIYDRDLLMGAIRDWNGGDVPHGTPAIIVMQPSKN